MNASITRTALAAAAIAVAASATTARADVKYRWFRNDSAVAANDFHAEKFRTSQKIKTASAWNNGTGNKAFPDKVFDPGTSSWDWTTAENMEEIPAGGFMKLCTEPGYPTVQNTKTYFTRNGTRIATSGFTSEKKAKAAGLAVSLELSNLQHSFPVVLDSIVVLVNNSMPAVPGFVPDGVPAQGLPAQLILSPAERLELFLPNADPLLAIYISCTVAPASTPSEAMPNEDILLPEQPQGFNYCSAVPSSTGIPAHASAWGSCSVFDNELFIRVENMPPDQWGYFLTSQTQGFLQPPLSVGNLCLGGNIARLNQQGLVFQGPVGEIWVDLWSLPTNPPQPAFPGDAWNFQCWYRDAGTSNFSDAVHVPLH